MGEKKKRKNTECVWWKCCIMYVWYHFVLLIWIIDMILAKCFLNNWIIYYRLCYLSVSQTWTKSETPPFTRDSQWVMGLLPLSPHMKRLVICCGPRWRNRLWSWTKRKHKDLCFTEAHVDGITQGSKVGKFVVQLVIFSMFVCSMWIFFKGIVWHLVKLAYSQSC